jgi:hypothetical protein
MKLLAFSPLPKIYSKSLANRGQQQRTLIIVIEAVQSSYIVDSWCFAMTSRPSRARTPTQRAVEAQAGATAAAALRTPPRSRGARSNSTALRRKALEGSQLRRSQSRAVVSTPTPSTQPPPSAQIPQRILISPSPPPIDDDESPAEEDDSEGLEGAEETAPQASIEKCDEDPVEAVDFDFRFNATLDGKGETVAYMSKLSTLDLTHLVNNARRQFERAKKPRYTVPIPEGVFKAQLLAGNQVKWVDNVDCNANRLDMEDELWRDFLRPFKVKAYKHQTARKSTVDLRMELTVPYHSKKVVRSASHGSASSSTNSSSDEGSRRHGRKRKSKSHGRESSTQKMRRNNRRDREIEDMNDSHYRLIRERFLCTAASCKNVGRMACIETGQPGKITGFAPGYIALGDWRMKRWNALIRDG